MTSRADLARRVLAILAADTGRTDADLADLTGASPADLSRVIGMLYRQGKADRCGPYLVPGPNAPATRRPAAPQPLLTAALAYIARGWPVFVLGRSKRPVANCPACPENAHDPAGCRHLTCHGFYAATTNPARLAAMLATVPGGLLAIRTGIASGLAVVDIDPRNGGQIDRALMTPTATVATGGGGWHLYYRRPGTPLPSKLPGHPGVDIKSDGGYVTAPPSLHPATGRPYQWANGRPPSEMPPALRAALAPPPQPPAPLRASLPARQAGGISDPAALLAAHLRAIQNAPEGRRRVTLYGAARGIARMIAAGAITADDARAALTQAGHAAGQTDRDIRAAIDGGFKDEAAA
jgi:Bifunctional DNA primase/polymerase, N-terminal